MDSQNLIAKPVVLLLSINISILVLECLDMPVITNVVLAMITVLATTVSSCFICLQQSNQACTSDSYGSIGVFSNIKLALALSKSTFCFSISIQVSPVATTVKHSVKIVLLIVNIDFVIQMIMSWVYKSLEILNSNNMLHVLLYNFSLRFFFVSFLLMYLFRI